MDAAPKPHAPLLRIAYVLALLALAQPLLAIALPEANGWRPDHDHVQLAGSPAGAHAHPYDHSREGPRSSTSTDVGFTAPDVDGSVAVLPRPTVPLAPEALRSTSRGRSPALGRAHRGGSAATARLSAPLECPCVLGGGPCGLSVNRTPSDSPA